MIGDLTRQDHLARSIVKEAELILETTNYYPLEGKLDPVLEQRRKATAIRVALGLKPGRIFVRLGEKGPQVKWECLFEDAADYEADMAARAASEDFAAAREQMHTMLDRFERHLHQSID